MSTMIREVYDAFKSIGIDDDKAAAAAEALSRHHQDRAQRDAKQDLKEVGHEVQAIRQDIQELRQEVRQDIQGLRQELRQDIQNARQDLREDTEGVRSGINGVGREIQDVRQELKREIARLHGNLKLSRWMVGFNMVLTAAVLIKLLF